MTPTAASRIGTILIAWLGLMLAGCAVVPAYPAGAYGPRYVYPGPYYGPYYHRGCYYHRCWYEAP